MTPPTAANRDDQRTEGKRLRIIAIAIPLAIGVVSLGLASRLKDSLPDLVATHWNASGRADGFSSRSAAIWQTGLGGVVGAVIVILSWRLIGRATSLLRAVTGAAAGVAAFMSSTFLVSLWVQRDLESAAEAPLPWWMFPAGALIGVGVGWAFAALIGAADRDYLVAHDPIPADAARLDIGPGERAAWAGWSRPSVASLAMTIGIVAVIAVVGSNQAQIPLLATLPLLAVVAMVLATMLVRVTVGRNGLVVRSVFGFALFRVPLDQVQEATTTEVHPLRQFGGWGLRLGRGHRLGLITSAGSALEVARGDGSRFVVTISRPQQPAALLNTLADQGRTT